MNNLKVYKLNELRQIARKQSYKMAALEGPDGRRLLTFNTLKKGDSIDKRFDAIPTRLESELLPDGIYFVLMAQSISGARNPDRYPIAKGNVTAESLAEAEKKVVPLSPTTIIHSAGQEVRGWDEALSDKEKIANLTAENARLTALVNEQAAEIDALNAELDEAGELGEGENTSPAGSFLKETVPTLLPILDRFLDQQDKRIELERMKLNGKGKSAPAPLKTAPRRKEIEAGSGEHLQLIEDLFNSGDDTRLNTELDKLEAASPELYKQVCDHLGIEEEGGEDGN